MRRLITLLLCLLPLVATAQSDSGQSDADRGYIQGLLEDAFSGPGRSVRIEGFRGALSSRATIDTLTISDADGVWLTARGLAMQWNRAGLLAGRVDIAELTATELDIPRAPLPLADPDLPTPEAAPAGQPFALPDLPVSLRVGTFRIDRATLGPAFLGRAATLRMEGSAALANGAGDADLRVTEAAGGTIALVGRFENATRRLVLDLALQEPAGGLVSSLMGLPGAPALDLTLRGDAPLEDFAADLRLSTAGTERLTGTATLAALRDPALPDAPPGWRFAADVAGDVATLFAPQFRAFFGPEVRLSTEGRRAASGALALDRLLLTADALTLSGTAELDPDGWPARLNLTADMAPPLGTSVLLPISGPDTRVDAARFALAFDAGAGEAWTLDGALEGLVRDGTRLDRASLTGGGQISRALSRVEGKVALAADGIALPEADLARAIGPTARAALEFGWTRGSAVVLREILAQAGPTQLAGGLTIAGPLETLTVTPDLALRADDLAVFAGLLGQPLDGRAEVQVTGPIQPLTGAFDLNIAGTTQDITLEEPRLDALLRGRGTLSAQVRRDETGLSLPALDIATALARITAAGRLETGGGDVTLTARLTDLAPVLPGLTGPATAQLTAQGAAEVWTVTGDATGPGDARLTLNATRAADGTGSGTARLIAGDFAPYGPLLGQRLTGAGDLSVTAAGTPDDASADITLSAQRLGLGNPTLDPLLGPTLSLTARTRYADGRVTVETATLTTPTVNATVSGRTDGATTDLTYDARLSDLARIAPGFPGAATARGTARSTDGQTWQIAASATGPGGIAADVAGSASAARLDLRATGSAPLALANPALRPRVASGQARFDLAIAGPPALSSLSGSVSTSDAGLALPGERLAFAPITADIRITGGRAQIDATAPSTTGGSLRISGPVTLAAPFNADLTVQIAALRLTDPTLYQTRANGTVTLQGALTGGARIAGAIDLDNTELRIPDGGASAYAGLPGLRHLNEPAEVRRTRSYAGLIETATTANAAPARAFPVDLILRAPTRIFVRGRGLDAELGGSLRLLGTTAALVPDGRFDLIRGRIDVLGQRLDLTRGSAQLQGSFDPYLSFTAETSTEGADVRVILEGLASAPALRLESSPALPEDEVLALLLFGREVAAISPFQAVRLALAIRTLTGGGGGFGAEVRRGLRLDDLDLRTTEDGTTEARVGAYLSDRLYSDVTSDSEGRSEINLNLRLSPSLTLRGSAASDGDTGVGVYFERDY